jgi:hypothetical protein
VLPDYRLTLSPLYLLIGAWRFDFAKATSDTSEFREVFSGYFLLSTFYFLSPLRARRGLRVMPSSALSAEVCWFQD